MNKSITIEERQKTFRAAGLALFCDAVGLLLMRLLIGFISPYLKNALSEEVYEILTDVIFSFGAQVLVSLGAGLLIYKLILKKSVKEIFYMSGYRPTDRRIYLVSFLIGICALIATIGVSTVWQTVLIMLGYTPSSSSFMPEEFSVWYLLLSLFLTAVLPAVCEEFINRGIFLGAMCFTFSKKTTVIICGIAFGLFHQYITQTFYTALMGMLLAYLVLTTKSIIPACIVHFTNNAISVAMDFIDTYSPANSPLVALSNFMTQNIGLMFLIVACAFGAIFALLNLIKKLYGEYYCKKYVKFMNSGSEEDFDAVTTFWTAADIRYKPTFRDCIFYYGAIVLTVLYTICTFIWGLF